MRSVYLDEAGISRHAKESVVVVAGVILNADEKWRPLRGVGLTMKTTVRLALMLLSFSVAAPSATISEQYALSERCGKTAAEQFKRVWGAPIQNDKDGSMIGDFTSHYNVKLNKCFVQQTTTGLMKAKGDTPAYSFYSVSLFDVLENKEYGEFWEKEREEPMQCFFRDVTCKSRKEWEALAKPYMEE